MDRLVERLGVPRRPAVWFTFMALLVAASFFVGACQQSGDVKDLSREQARITRENAEKDAKANRDAQLATWKNLQTGCGRANKRSEEFNKVVSQVGVYAIIFQQQIEEGAEALENELKSPERAKTYRARLKILRDLPPLKPVSIIDCADAYPRPVFTTSAPAPSKSGR